MKWTAVFHGINILSFEQIRDKNSMMAGSPLYYDSPVQFSGVVWVSLRVVFNCMFAENIEKRKKV